MDDIEIITSKDVWVAWTNTDLTEGRGYQIPLAVCESEATANRIGARGYVMGSACPVSKSKAVNIKGFGWLVPGTIHQETEPDKVGRLRLEEKRAAMEKARAAGLTDDELLLLRGNP